MSKQCVSGLDDLVKRRHASAFDIQHDVGFVAQILRTWSWYPWLLKASILADAIVSGQDLWVGFESRHLRDHRCPRACRIWNISRSSDMVLRVLWATEVAVLKTLALRLNDELLWWDSSIHTCDVSPGDADRAGHHAHVVSLTVDQFDIILCQQHVKLVLGDGVNSSSISSSLCCQKTLAAHSGHQAVMDYTGKYVESHHSDGRGHSRYSGAYSCCLHILWTLWCEFDDAIASGKGFQERSLHRLDGIVDILGHDTWSFHRALVVAAWPDSIPGPSYVP
jgi:hypothetical protein